MYRDASSICWIPWSQASTESLSPGVRQPDMNYDDPILVLAMISSLVRILDHKLRPRRVPAKYMQRAVGSWKSTMD